MVLKRPPQRVRFEIISETPRDTRWFCGHSCESACSICNHDLTVAALGMAQKIDMAVSVLRRVHDHAVVQHSMSLRADTATIIIILTEKEGGR